MFQGNDHCAQGAEGITQPRAVFAKQEQCPLLLVALPRQTVCRH